MATRILLAIACMCILPQCSQDVAWERELERRYEVVLSQLSFECHDPGASENHFVGTINSDTLCYGDGLENYRFWLGLGWTAITTEPVLNTNTTEHTGRHIRIGFYPIGNEPFEERLMFKFQGFPPGMPYTEIADSIFQVRQLPVSGLTDTDPWGVEAYVNTKYYEEGHSSIGDFRITTANGDQPPESIIEFTEVRKTKHDDRIEYEVVLRADCLLYHSLYRGENELFGELKGTLLARFDIPKGK